MAELTNLTDRIAHLRDRKDDSDVIQNAPLPSPANRTPTKPSSERKFATDTFMLFVYGLLGIALLAQMVLIVWLDII